MHHLITYSFKDMNNASNCTCKDDECDTVANTCGLHIMNGTSCGGDNGDNIGAYYHDANVSNPWTGANGAWYNNENTTVASKATVTATTGYNLTMDVGKVFVVYDVNAEGMGCGVLKDKNAGS